MGSGYRRWALLVMGLAPWVAAAAGSGAPASWPQEPRTVFGIRLGAPFPGPSEIADCPRFAPFRREPLYDGICVDTSAGFDADHIRLKNVPMAELSSEAEVRLLEGQVQSIVLEFDPKRLEHARSLLVARYGEPQDDGRNGGSAGEAPFRLAWLGPHTRITLSQPREQGPARLEFAAAAAR